MEPQGPPEALDPKPGVQEASPGQACSSAGRGQSEDRGSSIIAKTVPPGSLIPLFTPSCSATQISGRQVFTHRETKQYRMPLVQRNRMKCLGSVRLVFRSPALPILASGNEIPAKTLSRPLSAVSTQGLSPPFTGSNTPVGHQDYICSIAPDLTAVTLKNVTQAEKA